MDKQVKLSIRDKGSKWEYVFTPWFDTEKMGNPEWFAVITNNGLELARLPVRLKKRSMNKQEEIREGILLRVEDIAEREIARNHLDWIREFMQYLHSQGVVLRVDREFPEVEEDNPFARLDEQAKMLEAGYVATEPLVEE